MTPAEFAAYEASVRQAVERGKEQLQAKLMGQLTREQQKWWKEQRANLREEVAAEVDAEPVYAAFKALTAGQTEDGVAVKLSRAALVEQYGKDFLKRMPRSFQRIYTAEGGMDADTAAEVFGFDSGPMLLEALANMKPRREMIEAVTDARMVERHGDIRFDGTLADEAVQALHNDQRENVLGWSCAPSGASRPMWRRSSVPNARTFATLQGQISPRPRLGPSSSRTPCPAWSAPARARTAAATPSRPSIRRP